MTFCKFPYRVRHRGLYGEKNTNEEKQIRRVAENGGGAGESGGDNGSREKAVRMSERRRKWKPRIGQVGEKD